MSANRNQRISFSLVNIIDKVSEIMIFNGFQARILDLNHEPLAEVMPQPSIYSKEKEKGTSENQGSSLEEYTERIGQRMVKEYKVSLHREALQNFRCGAVQVKVNDEKIEKGGEITEGVTYSIRKGYVTRLFLAFRWVGTDHRNAARAHELEELHHSILPILHGRGLQEEAPSRNLIGKFNPSTKDEVTGKKPDRKRFKVFGRLKLSEKGKEMEKVSVQLGQSLPRYRTFSLRPKRGLQDSHPFLFQLCVNDRIVPLRKNVWTSDHNEKDGVMIAWLSEGAMIDLGRISISLKDLKEVKIKNVQSVTLHLWDAMRKELWSNAVTFTMTGSSGLVYPTCDIRQISPPNAILHFDVIAFKKEEDAENAVQSTTQPVVGVEEKAPSIEEALEEPHIVQDDKIANRSRADQGLSTVIESSQEHSLNSAIEGTVDRTVEHERDGRSTPLASAEGTNSEIQKQRVITGTIPERRSSLINRSRTNSLQATVQSYDQSHQPIGQLFEEVDRLRFEHEHLKESLAVLDGHWRNTVLTELQKIKGEIRDRVEIDRDYYNKLKKRFSMPSEAFASLNKGRDN